MAFWVLFKHCLFSTRSLDDGVSKDSLLFLPSFSLRADYYLWVVAVFCCGVFSLEYRHMSKTFEVTSISHKSRRHWCRAKK